MAIYYIDPFNGSDSRDGLTWATAWASTYPLRTVYAAVTQAWDLELRFAKSVPTHNRSFTFIRTNGIYSTSANQAIVASSASIASHRKIIFGQGTATSNDLSTFNGSVVYPFTVTPPYSGYNTSGGGKFYIKAPPTTNAVAAKFPLSSAQNFSDMEEIELVVSGLGHTNVVSDREEVSFSLRLCSDSGGVNTVWTGTAKVLTMRGVSIVRFSGPFPNASVSSAAIDIKNPTTVSFTFEASECAAVRRVSDPNYIGIQTAFLPNDHDSMPLVPVALSGTQFLFNGVEGRAIDDVRAFLGQPQREWTAYNWKEWPYEAREAARFSKLGAASAPVTISGGWNTTTGVQDGISVIAATNLMIFDIMSEAYLRINRLMPVFPLEQTDGVMAKSIDPYATSNIDVEQVYTPLGGLEFVDMQVGRHTDTTMHNALLGDTGAYNDERKHTVRIRDSWGMGCAPIVLRGSFDIDNSTIGFVLPIDAKNGVWENLTMIGMTKYAPFWYAKYEPLRWRNCKVISNGAHTLFTSENDAGLEGPYDRVTMVGAYTGVSSDQVATDCVFWPVPSNLGPISAGGKYTRLSFGRSDSAVYSTTPMFGTGRSELYANGSVINVDNSTLPVPFVSVTEDKMYAAHRATMENVTVIHTPACSGTAFPLCSLLGKDLVLSGAWACVSSGALSVGDLDGLVITNANTKVFDNFYIPGASGRQGRVASRIKRINHPRGSAGILGTPSHKTSSGACYFTTDDGGSMWVTTSISVERDTTLQYAGPTSWKVRPLLNVGSPTRGSFPIGVFKLQQGQTLVAKAHVNRDSEDIIGGLLLIPSSTTATDPLAAAGTVSPIDYVTAFVQPDSPRSQWVEVVLTYTAAYAGLVELFGAVRGLTGTSLNIDNIKVQK